MRRQSLKYAGFWKRFGAALVDLIVLAICAFLVGMSLEALIGLGPPNRDGDIESDYENMIKIFFLCYFIAFGLQLVYFIGMESSPCQGTLGKMALGIKVTDLEGERISFMRASGRWFAKMMSVSSCFVGFITVGFNERKQALHDILVRTLVIDRESTIDATADRGLSP